MKPIGIDLGTTYSAVATLDADGKPIILKNAENEDLTPSVIFFPSNGAEPVAGKEAKDEQLYEASSCAAFFKSEMGNQNWGVNFNGKDYPASMLSAELLKKLKRDAEGRIGEDIKDAVITIPAYFQDAQCRATKEAAENAGLNVLQLLHEPVAAALAYGLGKASADKTSRVTMVYDLGGGTFDVTIVKIEFNGKIPEFRVVATEGDHHLGGKNWDETIALFIKNSFQEEFGIDPSTDPSFYQDLVVDCERYKKELSVSQQVNIVLSYGGYKGKYVLTREKFEEITQALFERTMMLSDLAVENAAKEIRWFSWKKIDEILLVGGSTKMPRVEAFLLERTGKEPLRGVDADRAVAMGAAILADQLLKAKSEPVRRGFLPGSKPDKGRLPGMILRDGTAHTLGIVAESKDRNRYVNSKLLPKNSEIPAESQDVMHGLAVPTSGTRKSELDAFMLQGEGDTPSECDILGKYIFSGIEPVPSGVAKIAVRCSYDTSNIAHISAVQKETGKALPMREIKATDANLAEWRAFLSRSPRENAPDPTPKVTVDVALIIDDSGSMGDVIGDAMRFDPNGHSITEARKAAINFIEKLNTPEYSIGIGLFGDKAKVIAPLTQKHSYLLQCASNIQADNAGTNGRLPLDLGRGILSHGHGKKKYIILLTDGVWEHQDDAIKQSQRCKAAGIEIVAIGIGTADQAFLRQIATSSEGAIYTNVGNLKETFSRIATRIG